MCESKPWLRHVYGLCGTCLIAGSLSSCASPVPVPATQDIIVVEVTPQQVREGADVEAVVRWGGTIAGVQNRDDGKSVLEIVSRPLSSTGRPIRNDKTNGRFMAETSEFLDPEIFTAGRDITVVGIVAGVQDGKVGETDYVFPLVSIDTYQYWKKAVVVPQRHFPHWNQHPRDIHDPFWRDWPFPPPQRRRSGSGVYCAPEYALPR